MKREKMKSVLIWIPTLLICFIVLWPVYWIVKSSFTPELELYSTPVQYLPTNLTVSSYEILFSTANMEVTWKSTVIVVVLTMVLATFFCGLAAYSFSRNKSKILSVSFTYLLFSTMVPMSVTLVPLTILWKNIGLTDTILGTVILYLSMVIPFNTLTYTGFISGIPYSLEEAAMLDGANSIQVFIRIILPLMTPVIATMNIINFINCVNEFFIPLNFTSRNVKMLSTITSAIPIQNEFQLPWEMISAVGVLMVAPSILFVICFEKKIMAGLIAGSVKQ